VYTILKIENLQNTLIAPEGFTPEGKIDLVDFKFKCKDIGMNCGFEVKGASSRDEVMQIALVHAKQTHQMATIPPDVASKVSSAIKS
jgi:predicted small metal-binding protein